MATALARTLAQALTEWFVRAHRPMPWRNTRDPYAIWVSEIMLQQTRVDTVLRYYDRFLARFPDVTKLAAADEDGVLEAWSGLGYYRRARLLHRGARYVARELEGRVPDNAEDLRMIPGIGRYTAGAIAAIAFDRPEPLVDGNVARVSSRLRAVEDPREQDAAAEHHWSFVGRILAHGSPRLLSQALMELGATVCTPKTPNCSGCPVQKSCASHRLGLVERIPAPRTKPAQPEQRWHALAVHHAQRLLFVRRPMDGLLAGLWCWPLFEADGPPKRPPTLRITKWLGVEARVDKQPLPVVKHVFTHRIWHLHPWRVSVARRPAIAADHAWIDASGAPEGGIPNLTRKLLRRIGWE